MHYFPVTFFSPDERLAKSCQINLLPVFTLFGFVLLGWHNGGGTLYYLRAEGKHNLQLSVRSDRGAESSIRTVNSKMSDSTTLEKGRDTLQKTGHRKKLLRGFLQIQGQHSSLGLFKDLCLLMSLHSSFFPFCLFPWESKQVSCFSLGKFDWHQAIDFPGKKKKNVVISLPFAILQLAILVLSVTCRHYFDTFDTILHRLGRWEECLS